MIMVDASKHQLELDEKKKKGLDKQLEFLLGRTERKEGMIGIKKHSNQALDIESERIWKLAQAKKVEIRANQATRGEKRVKLELDEKKKKALDKQLGFFLGQTERNCYWQQTFRLSAARIGHW
ncbi:hypothetical protein Sango_2721900 [Sesamum angolense]|uniref:Uncharacterized protein n=1 Tax=Sesamum angolense TaxID=2727404 RepID=A0AAE1VYV2_9LAMI|nr:hypothetical protein Sango_2721900 [Sesamum angolense]